MEARHKLVQCPLDHQHFVKAGRLQQHIVKCRKNHLSEEFKTCPFNACHLLHPAEELRHIAHCPDRVVIQRQLHYEVRTDTDKMTCGDLTRPDFTTEPVPCDEVDTWQEGDFHSPTIPNGVTNSQTERVTPTSTPEETHAEPHCPLPSKPANDEPVHTSNITLMRRSYSRLNRDSSSDDATPKTLPKSLAHRLKAPTPKPQNADSETTEIKTPGVQSTHDDAREEFTNANPRSIQEMLADIEQAVAELKQSPDQSNADATAPQPRCSGLGRGLLKSYRAPSTAGTSTPEWSVVGRGKMSDMKGHSTILETTKTAPGNVAKSLTADRDGMLEARIAGTNTVTHTNTTEEDSVAQTMKLDPCGVTQALTAGPLKVTTTTVTSAMSQGRGRGLELLAQISAVPQTETLLHGVNAAREMPPVTLSTRLGRGILALKFLKDPEPTVGNRSTRPSISLSSTNAFQNATR